MAHELKIPNGWGLTQLSLHYVDDVAATETDRAYAGNVSALLRMDAPLDEALEQVSAQDAVRLKGSIPHFKIITQGSESHFPILEYTLKDPSGEEVRQIVIYLRRERHVYTVVGSHRSRSFDAVRKMAFAIATQISTEQ